MTRAAGGGDGCRTRGRLRSEDGLVAGGEALAFAVLVFVFGTLLVANAWRVVDAKFATSAAAREAVRAVVEAPADLEVPRLLDRARTNAGLAVLAHGYATDDLEVAALLPVVRQRCAPVRLSASLDVQVAFLPWLPERTRYTVSSTYEEVVDPYRSGLPDAGEVVCGF